jgi:hypothetical protein
MLLGKDCELRVLHCFSIMPKICLGSLNGPQPRLTRSAAVNTDLHPESYHAYYARCVAHRRIAVSVGEVP